MKRKFKPIDLTNIETYSIKHRKSKVDVKDLGSPYQKGSSFSDFVNTLPDILAARDIKEVAESVVTAYKAKKLWQWGWGPM